MQNPSQTGTLDSSHMSPSWICSFSRVESWFIQRFARKRDGNTLSPCMVTYLTSPWYERFGAVWGMVKPQWYGAREGATQGFEIGISSIWSLKNQLCPKSVVQNHVNLYTWIFQVYKSAAELHPKTLGRKCYIWKILVPAGENGREQERVGAFSGYRKIPFDNRAPRSYLPKGFEMCTSSVSAILFGVFRAGKAMGNIGAVCRQQGNFQAQTAPGVGETRNMQEISMQDDVLFKYLIIFIRL